MRKFLRTALLAALTLSSLSVGAQDLRIKGVAQMNRYDDGEQMNMKYIAWNYDLQKGISIGDYGTWALTWDGLSLSAPAKDPNYNISDFYSGGKFTDNDKALLVTNMLNMVGNSGAVYVDGIITTVFSRDEQSTVDEELFRVCKWDAKTGEMLSNQIFPKSANIESAGMSYNPKDGKVYGLFYLTEQALGEEITSDPDFFTDTDGDATSTDAGYAICTIDLNTMKITPVTPGLYYYNFVTFAINSEGRAFALTSGGASGVEDANGVMTDINGKRTGAQLCEFDLSTGLLIQNEAQLVDPETGENYTELVFPVDATGYPSQYRRQAACFDKNEPNKMYWIGYYNSGKGINSWGSWGQLPDSEWRTNGKYDTALYEVDIKTGAATRLAKIKNRFIFSALWIDGADCSDGSGVNGIESLSVKTSGAEGVYNLSGQKVFSGNAEDANLTRGIYVVKSGDKSQKIIVR